MDDCTQQCVLQVHGDGVSWTHDCSTRHCSYETMSNTIAGAPAMSSGAARHKFLQAFLVCLSTLAHALRRRQNCSVRFGLYRAFQTLSASALTPTTGCASMRNLWLILMATQALQQEDDPRTSPTIKLSNGVT